MLKSMPNSAKKMPNFLYKQSKSSLYSVRLVPSKNQIKYGAKEFRKSLGTADRKIAKLYAAPLIAQKLSEWHALEREPVNDIYSPDSSTTRIVLTEQIIAHICMARELSVLQSDEEDRMDPDGLFEADFKEIEELCATTDAATRAALSGDRQSPLFLDFLQQLEEWTSTMGYEISSHDVLFPKLIRKYAATEQLAYSKLIERNRGNDIPTPLEPIFDQNVALLSHVLPYYTEYKQKTVAQKTFSTHLNALNSFIAFNGDAALKLITSVDIYSFFEHQVKSKVWTPSYITKTVKSVFVTFFDVAISRSLLVGQNPAKTVLVPTVSKKEAQASKKHRYPYSSEQLSKIFTGFWYDINEKTRITGKLRDDLGLRYFGPLLSMCHGVRVRELVQLRVGDILFSDGDIFLNFTLDLDESLSDPSLPERGYKNLQTQRKLPVHKLLLKQGFVEFVQSMQAVFPSDKPLFPSAVPEPGGAPMWGRAYEQAFLRYSRDKLDFGNGFGNHSFRHAFEDRIRDAEAQKGPGSRWPSGISQYLSGRKRSVAAEGSAAIYGHGYNASQVRPYLDEIEFSDVKLPPPYFQWLITKNS